MLVDINLLPKRDRERSKAVILSILILLAAVLGWLALYVMAKQNTDEAERMNAQTTQIQLQEAELRSRMQGTETMADREQLELTIDWAESYQFPTAPLLRHLVSLLPGRGFITDYTYTGPHTADLSVQFDRYEQAAFYVARLKSASQVHRAILNDVVAVQLNEETDEEGNPVEADETVVPRYVASFTIDFYDPRIPAEGTAEEPADGEAPDESVTDEGTVDETEVEPDNQGDPDTVPDDGSDASDGTGLQEGDLPPEEGPDSGDAIEEGDDVDL